MSETHVLAGRPPLRRALFAIAAVSAITEHLALLIYVIAPRGGAVAIAATTAMAVLIMFAWTAVVDRAPSRAVIATAGAATVAAAISLATESLPAAMLAAVLAPAIVPAARHVAADAAPPSGPAWIERIGLVVLGLIALGLIAFASNSVGPFVWLCAIGSLASICLATTHTAPTNGPGVEHSRREPLVWAREELAWWREELAEHDTWIGLLCAATAAAGGGVILTGAAEAIDWPSLRPALLGATGTAVIAVVVRGSHAPRALPQLMLIASVLWLAVGSQAIPLYVMAAGVVAAWLLAMTTRVLPDGRDAQTLLSTAVVIGAGIGALIAQTAPFHELGAYMITGRL